MYKFLFDSLPRNERIAGEKLHWSGQISQFFAFRIMVAQACQWDLALSPAPARTDACLSFLHYMSIGADDTGVLRSILSITGLLSKASGHLAVNPTNSRLDEN